MFDRNETSDEFPRQRVKARFEKCTAGLMSTRSMQASVDQKKRPMLFLGCALVGAAYFGLAMGLGALPFFFWFKGSSVFWPLWMCVSLSIGAKTARVAFSSHADHERRAPPTS